MDFFQNQVGHKRTCVHGGWGPGGGSLHPSQAAVSAAGLSEESITQS